MSLSDRYVCWPALAGNVIFPGLPDHTIEVMETSPIYQSCRVEKVHGDANYTYHWLGPDQRKVANGSQLTIDYALRSRHSGAYTCVAKSKQAAHRDLEGTVYVIVSRESKPQCNCLNFPAINGYIVKTQYVRERHN